MSAAIWPNEVASLTHCAVELLSLPTPSLASGGLEVVEGGWEGGKMMVGMA
jgi:hypothetical protein